MNYRNGFIVAVLAAAGTLGAQTPPPRHERLTPEAMQARIMDRLGKKLTLTEAQKEKGIAIFTASHTQTAAMRKTMRAAHDALTEAVKKNNGIAIDQASLQIGNLMAQEMSINSKAEAAFRAQLSPDQLTKYEARDERAARGPGGPGGPGGPNGFRRGPGGPPPDQQ